MNIEKSIKAIKDIEKPYSSTCTCSDCEKKRFALKEVIEDMEEEKPESTCKWDLVGFTYWPKCRAENCTDKMSFGKSTIGLYIFCPFCGRKIEPRHA